MTAISDKSTQAQIELKTEQGELVCSVSDICSRRIKPAARWVRFVDNPTNNELSQPLETLSIERAHVRHVSLADLPEDEVELDWCSDYILTESERDYYLRSSMTGKRKREWLAGRIAAKEAIADALSSPNTGLYAAADLEITGSRSVKPTVRLRNGMPLPALVEFSISHSKDHAIAIAQLASAKGTHQTGGVGIDIERVERRDEEFSTTFLSPEEHQFLETADSAQRDLLLTALWVCKESTAKGSGNGIDRFDNYKIVDFSWEERTASVLCQGEEMKHVLLTDFGDHIIGITGCIDTANRALSRVSLS